MNRIILLDKKGMFLLSDNNRFGQAVPINEGKYLYWKLLVQTGLK